MNASWGRSVPIARSSSVVASIAVFKHAREGTEATTPDRSDRSDRSRSTREISRLIQ